MPSDTVMLVGTFIPILAILMGGLLLLVPIAGLTLRFALKPVLESLGPLRDLKLQGQELRLLEQRLSLLEEQMHALAAGARSDAAALTAMPVKGLPIGRIADLSAEAGPA